MKLGCPMTRTMFRTVGLITWTVVGFVALVKLTSPLWLQPGIARADRRPKRSQQR